jgi:hypothetical protein
MNNPSRESGSTIDKLLQDRAQYVSWLTRLNSGGDSAAVPESVRGRVRADYERRLESVLEELREHINALEEQVEGLSARAQELSVREAEHREQLAEAEVRHAVGEYDEVKWEGIRAELFKLITHVNEELNHTTAEVDRLVEVLDTIRAPILPEIEPEIEPQAPPPPPPSVSYSAPRPAASAPPGMPGLINPTASPVPEQPRPAVAPPAYPAAQAQPPAAVGEIPFRQTAPRHPVRPTAPPAVPRKDDQQPGRTLWFPSGKPEGAAPGGGKLDELAFLKSVTGSEAPPSLPATPVSSPTPVPRRASGGFSRPPAAPEPAPPAPMPREVPSTPPPPLPEPPVAKAQPPIPEASKDRPSAGQKTLKCAECGTLNRPTEWYCERCGAELAAL